MKNLLFVLFLVNTVVLRGQNDSTLILEPAVLKENDIMIRPVNVQPEIAIAATRVPDITNDLPFTIWTISAAEILRNGFVTLGDVLKAAPGIRVSQPGNALDGETFLMRGLAGNQYVKILINNLPIKPNILRGMPIGAQLPIRQAERIEVIFGSQSALFGSDACAGIINIVLKESERPLYTQADLTVGNNGFNSLDLMFGGKLGKDKKIFRFSLYGSSTVRSWYQTDQYNNPKDNLLQPRTYLPANFDSTLFLNNPNYRHQFGNQELAFANSMSHESRMFGINLHWRAFQFNYHRMLRSDHTALGLNPLAISWANPSNQIQEQLDVFNIRLQRNKKNRNSLHALTFLTYKVDPNSSATYLSNHLVRTAFKFDKLQGNSLPDDQLLLQNFNRYASGERYHVAGGYDIKLESKSTYFIGSKFRVTGGYLGGISGGDTYTSYLFQPNDYKILGGNRFFGPFDPVNMGAADANIYAQLEWRTSKIYLNVRGLTGASINKNSAQFATAPQLAMSYKIDSFWSVWGNYSTGFRYPTLFNSAHTYFVGNSSFLQNGWFEQKKETKETTQNVEGGIRFHKNDVSFDLSAFSQQANNLIRNDITVKTANTGGGTIDQWIYGYQNVARQHIWGIQGLLRSENQEIDINNNNRRRKDVMITGRTEYFIQYTRGWEYPGAGIEPVHEIFNQPRWHRQFRFFLKAGKLELMVSTNTQSSVLSKSLLYRDREGMTMSLSRYPRFRTNDASLRWYFSRYFVGYIHGQNIFNRQYAGLDATGTPDDLLFNLQQGRMVRLGVSYSVN